MIAAIDYLILPAIALVAFVLKAMTGFGPAIIVISLGSLVVEPQTIVATSAVLDSIAGAILLRSDWVKGGYRYWLPLAAAIVIGSVVGAISLKAIPADHFRRMLGIALFVLGVWFIAGRTGRDGSELDDALPEGSNFADRLATFVGGVLGGLIGISGPPIIWHFGRRFAKRVFRQILVPVFLIAAVARSATYASIGLMDAQVFRCVGLALPGLVIGILLGNRIFLRLSEVVFSRIVGSVLVAAALRILFE